MTKTGKIPVISNIKLFLKESPVLYNFFLLLYHNRPRKNLNLYYAFRGKFIFIRMHKVGGTSISNALGIEKRHYTTKQIINIVGRSRYERCYTFTFVRNPYSKMVSTYKYFTKLNLYKMGENPIPFPVWVEKTIGHDKDPNYFTTDKYLCQQVDWLKDDKGLISLDKIGKFENIREDFNEIARKLNIDSPLPHLNATKKSDYRKYYDQNSFALVKNYYQDDLTYFGYEFDS